MVGTIMESMFSTLCSCWGVARGRKEIFHRIRVNKINRSRTEADNQASIEAKSRNKSLNEKS